MRIINSKSVLVLLFISALNFQFLFAQKSVLGHYVSRFAQGGWFVTQIQLNEDSTFKYQRIGDMSFDLTDGKFYINHDTIEFQYHKEPEFDTIKISNDSLFLFPRIVYDDWRPCKALFDNNKLWVIYADNKVVKKLTAGHNKRFEFKDKKYFLKRVKYGWVKWN